MSNQNNVDATASDTPITEPKPSVFTPAQGEIVKILFDAVSELTAQCAAQGAEIAGLRDQLTDIRQDQAA